MDTLVSFLTSMLALSIGVERIVEAAKGMVPWLRSDPDPAGSQAAHRRLALQLLAAVAGAVTAALVGPKHFLPTLTSSNPAGYAAASGLLGMMASGGSAFWNHALDIIGAIKNVKEQVAAQGTSAPPAAAPPLPIPVGP
ncbi:MAG: hypothetical protein ACRENE_31815 [Polyangiaceae bacterium]